MLVNFGSEAPRPEIFVAVLETERKRVDVERR